jgi:hypothetical protein
MSGEALDIRRLQNRLDRLAAVGALGALDLTGYFPIDIMDRRINTSDGTIRSLEKTPKCPVGLFTFLRELLNSPNVGFEAHTFEGLPRRLRDAAISCHFLFERLVSHHFLMV